MKRWFSPRGARRGLLLAGITAALWMSWAAGYVHGSRTSGAASVPNVGDPGQPNVTLSRSVET